jgi:predicted Zn-dependent protease
VQVRHALLQLMTDQVRARVVAGVDVAQLGGVVAGACPADTPEVNASALPGGFLYVNRGLIEWAQSESELAAVLSHEVGHVVGRHGANNVARATAVDSILSEFSTALLGTNTPAKVVQRVGGLSGGEVGD